MPSFRLDAEPWIPVVWHDGRQAEASLLEVIEGAAGIRRIVGNPLEVAVLIRLLLAIAHAVDTPEDEDAWAEMWNRRPELLEKMASHVREHAAAFDLYDEDRPFAQHPGLPEPSATPAILMYDRAQGNNPVFLDGSRVAFPQPISSAQAARSLLVAHAFGGSGTGGANPLNGGKKDTMYAGPLCARMIGVLEGRSLTETIALNLVSGVRVGRPAWLRSLASAPGQTPSEGVADLYTRPTRLARLKPNKDGQFCVAACLYMGQALPAEESDEQDPMMQRYVAKDKKLKVRRLAPDRAVWREADALLMAEANDYGRPLRAIEQIRPLLSEGLIARDEPVSLRILGVAANAQGPVTEMWRDESLRFELSLVADDARYGALHRAVEAANLEGQRLRTSLFRFAQRYLADGGGSPDPKDVDRMTSELSPDLADYWSAVGPQGERIALSDFDEAIWQTDLSLARRRAYGLAMDRLPLDARRMRAQFAHDGTTPKKAVGGKGK